VLIDCFSPSLKRLRVRPLGLDLPSGSRNPQRHPGGHPYTRRAMIIYLFRDIDADDIFAFSNRHDWHKYPPVTQTTDWLFQEALDLMEFANRTIGDFRKVLDRLKTDGFYLFQTNH
jgi:hypothetical protein